MVSIILKKNVWGLYFVLSPVSIPFTTEYATEKEALSSAMLSTAINTIVSKLINLVNLSSFVWRDQVEWI